MTKTTLVQPTVYPPTPSSVNNCTSVSIYCPVDFTIYGFAPNLGANAFFCAIFAVFFFVQLFQGLRWKTWTYLIGLGFGCLGEAIGYVGRIMLHNNAWDGNGFDIQICCLIISPAFITAGVYITLKHIVLEVGPEFSRLKPRLYTWIFILCDLFSLVLQGAGGGIAATANNGSNMVNVGNNLMISGIVWQVFTLLIFGGLVADYANRVIKRRSELSPSAIKLMHTPRFELFIGGLTLAFITIFTRCVFRIGEMANGWGNSIMQDETDFIVLDGVMVTIAALCLTLFHPGYTFPEMQMHGKTSPVGELSAARAEKVADFELTSAPSERGGKKGFFGRGK